MVSHPCHHHSHRSPVCRCKLCTCNDCNRTNWKANLELLDISKIAIVCSTNFVRTKNDVLTILATPKRLTWPNLDSKLLTMCSQIRRKLSNRGQFAAEKKKNGVVAYFLRPARRLETVRIWVQIEMLSANCRLQYRSVLQIPMSYLYVVKMLNRIKTLDVICICLLSRCQTANVC